MRLILFLAAAVALSAATPPPELQQFEDALAGSHFSAAAEAIDKLMQARTPTDGKPHRDTLLNSLIGRLYLAAHETSAAAIYLKYAPIAELPAALRAPTALAHGRSLELEGNRRGALDAYQNASIVSQMDSERRRAVLGIARQLLPQDPAAAREQLLPIANGPAVPKRWEARYLIAAASSLLGDSNSAMHWAEDAWADAANAPLDDLATLHVATLRAGLAAARHDVASERAMLIATNGLSLSASGSLSAQLPVCGDAGIIASDFVTFGFLAGPFATRHLIPIAASRAAAVAPFYDALNVTSPIKEGNGTKPIGTVFTVSCRSIVSSNFVAKPVAEDPLIEWSVDQGIYPASAWNDSDDEHLNAVGTRIDSLAARFGKDSPLLIAPRWQLMGMLEARARGGDVVPAGQLTDLRTQISAGLRHAGAPEWLAQTVDLRTSLQQLAEAAASGSDQTSAYLSLMHQQLLRTPFNFSRQLLMTALNNVQGQWPPQAAQFVLDLNRTTPSTLAGRERQAWLLTVAQAQRLGGRDQDALTTIAAAHIEGDLCAAADQDVSLLEQHFSYSDYPEELIAGEQEGVVLFEFNLSAQGAVTRPRVVYSLPSGIFDQPSEKGLATVRYTSPQHGGRASPCRALYQPIRWQLEDTDDVSGPALTPEMTAPTT